MSLQFSPAPRPPAAPRLARELNGPLPFLLPAARAICDLAPRDCRWPLGALDDQDFRFCGDPRRLGSAYCATHHGMSRTGGAL